MQNVLPSMLPSSPSALTKLSKAAVCLPSVGNWTFLETPSSVGPSQHSMIDHCELLEVDLLDVDVDLEEGLEGAKIFHSSISLKCFCL